MLSLLVATLLAASPKLDVAIDVSGRCDADTHEAAEESLKRTVREAGYNVVPIARDVEKGVWVQVYLGMLDAPHESRLLAFDGHSDVAIHVKNRALRATADSSACGEVTYKLVGERVLEILKQAEVALADESALEAWPVQNQPVSWHVRWMNRFSGAARPLEIGVIGAWPGSDDISYGVSARLNAHVYGIWAGVGPDFMVWAGRNQTIYEPALALGLHAGQELGRDYDLAVSVGFETALVVDISHTSAGNDAEVGARFGVPLTFGVDENRVVLTVMPYVRTNAIDMPVDDSYRAEHWGVLGRISVGFFGE